MDAASYPRVIWCLGLQGWSSAPPVARACLESWRRLNPTYRVHALDESTIGEFLPQADWFRLVRTSKEHEALSDEIRIELLARYGGVWADATTMCMTPLDAWLPKAMPRGFFAFSKPSDDRLISSWFLAAEKGNALVESWRASVSDYWKDRSARHDYFWFHQLFAQQYEVDCEFRRMWDETPKVSAVHRGHFGPLEPRLTETITAEGEALIAHPPAPVFKLTHKVLDDNQTDSLIDRLCDWGAGRSSPAERCAPQEPTRARVLVTWYGSFAGHGTVGDQRSMEAVVSHLVARGHVVSHASASPIEIPGAPRVEWSEPEPLSFDAIIFVCGPILSFHFLTNALFERFKGRLLAGIGVSLMPPESDSFSNPFDFVLAREGQERSHGDLAIVGPLPSQKSSAERRDVGLALRGEQQEYGVERCLWKETELYANSLASFAAAETGGEIVHIENHLDRSGGTADQIERLYDQCRLIITSRFHGAITALRHGIPFIALDQIEGGAKVTALLSNLGWPFVYSIDEAMPETLERASSSLLAGTHRETLENARHIAVREANRSLLALDGWLETTAEYSK